MSQEPNQHGYEEYQVSHQGSHGVDQGFAQMQGDAASENWGIRPFQLLFA
jgi:hypothetical protein